MRGQKHPQRFRRCYSCNAKSYGSLWDENKCPVCGSGEGFWTSTHGEITSKKQAAAIQERVILTGEREVR